VKGFAIPLLGVIFVLLIAGSVQYAVADHLLPGKGIMKDENNVNLALSIDSKYKIYLHVVIRNAQDQLVSVIETMHGKYVPHEITDFVFDKIESKRGIVIIDKIKYEKIQYTMTYDIQQASFTKSYVDFLTLWTLKFDVNVDGHGLYEVPVFQARAPLTLAEGEIITFHWTILRELN